MDGGSGRCEGAALASHRGAARSAFNWGLHLVKAAMGQRAAEQT
ncbi:hypothetical protein FHR32_007377 [Streptosporangium album]|uniref:Uncharacterized protein n=1 Tax=Streptosporangium album TaxID=47479 RepID=A0A7W7S3F8_9ACTN|nr:hypothetical protein [Streptosporangium album]MBB4942977.1 hypothetical protein [Streptosporangium album]